MSFDQILINIIIVSIPEEIFLTLIILLLLGRYDFFDKYTLESSFTKAFFIVVLPCALLFSYNLYILNISLYFRIGINILILSICIGILIKSVNVVKILVASTVAFAILIVIESARSVLMVSAFNLNVSVINSSALSNFILFIPERIIQFSTIYIIYLKKNWLLNISIVKVWSSNLYLRIITYIFMFIDIAVILFLYSKFAADDWLGILPDNYKGVVVMVIFILLVSNIVIPWVTIYSICPGKIYIKR